jgi:DNA-binding GntR family transcriptional regulator
MERVQTKLAKETAAKEEKTRERMAEAMMFAANQPGGRFTLRGLRENFGWNNDTARHIVYRLQQDRLVRAVEFKVPSGKGAMLDVSGFEVIK